MPLDNSDFTGGAVAPANRYIAYGALTEVEDLDGSIVAIEVPYAVPMIVDVLEAGQRGNLLVAATTEVSDEVAAQLAD